MAINPIFGRVFRKLHGEACWGVKPGHGSFLTFEFGEPHLGVNEPKALGTHFSPIVRRRLAQRRIYGHGDWHLWIYCCDWEIFIKGKQIANSQSSQTYEKGAQALDGQRLVRFSLQPRGLRTTFELDLGGVLVTRPYNRRSEHWMLYCPSRKVLTLRADKKYSYHVSNRSTKAVDWKPIAMESK